MLNHTLRKTYPRADALTLNDIQKFINMAVKRGCPLNSVTYYRASTNSETHTTSVELTTSWNEEEQ